MSRLGDKLRNARRFTREIEGWRLVLRRPTDEEMRKILADDHIDYMDVCKRFVVDWQGVTEQMIVGSAGNDQEVNFDPDTWQEFIVDQPALWEPIVKEIVGAYEAHSEKRGDNVKNS